MAFIIWYQLAFPKAGPLGLVPLRVSNDVFSGDYVLDSEIQLTMIPGDVADRFSITLVNLPGAVADDLKKLQRGAPATDPLQVEISLGYFEDAPQLRAPNPVMVGVVTAVESDVNGAGLLVTKLEGLELAGYRLRNSGPIVKHFSGEATSLDLLAYIKNETKVEIGQPPPATLTLRDYTLRAENALGALRSIAILAESPLLIRDGAIFMGPAVGSSAPVAFSPDRNLVSHTQGQVVAASGDPRPRSANGQAPPAARDRREVMVLGHPGLRVGQMVQLELDGPSQGPLYITQLVHSFSTESGYVCRAVISGTEPGRVADGGTGADALVDRFRDLAEATQAHQTAIDVGEVTTYEPGSQQKHLATLNYGQSPAAGVVAPSVTTPVDAVAQLQQKPIASPFAWHKCGLMTPIYPGMRALLAHNEGLANDAIVAGFLWSENPVDARPQNEPGDFWLCLPTELDGSARPVGKGVNDLTNAAGLRVIQVKGLCIAVGADLLPEVGQRPETPADLAGTLVIDHQSGTRITIDPNGAIAIETDGQEITLSTGAGATMKVTTSGVEVS